MAKTITEPRAGVALIGAGMIANTHVSALSEAQDSTSLRYILSRNPDKAAPLADLYHGPSPEFTTDIEKVASDPDISVAIVATPPSVRAEIISVLADSGTHILLEKPVGRNLSEAEDVVRICESAGVSLGVLFQHRARATSIAAAELIKAGTLGQLGLVEIEVPLWRDQSYYNELGRGTYARDGGGVMITNAIHSLDLALNMTSHIARVTAMTGTTSLHRMEAEDLAVAGLEFACGAKGSFVASTAMFPHRTEVIRLHFEKASLQIDKNALEVSWRDGRFEIIAAEDTAHQVDPLRSNSIWHQAVIEDFVTSVREGRPPMVTGREALRSHVVIDAIERSSRDGSPVDLACAT